MRMRRKNNLDARLLACSDYFIGRLFRSGEVETADFNKIFGNENPVWLEIGCGKGGFINQAAKIYENKNFLAIEKSENVIVTAAEGSVSGKIPNIRYIIGLAEYMERIIPPCSIERIFLNFSCPFPKKQHEKRRLTHKLYLDIYKKLLKPNGEIKFKTDNANFFEYSLKSFSENGFRIQNVTRDLHNGGISGNIITGRDVPRLLGEGTPSGVIGGISPASRPVSTSGSAKRATTLSLQFAEGELAAVITEYEQFFTERGFKINYFEAFANF